MKINYMHNTAPGGRAAEAVMRHGQYFSRCHIQARQHACKTVTKGGRMK